MRDLKKKLEDLQQLLPVDLIKFIASVKLPQDEDCFEFSYFKTFINIIGLFKDEDIKLIVHKNKNVSYYRQLMKQNFELSNPDNSKDKFDVEIDVLANGVGDHRFAKITYDGVVFFIDPEGTELLKCPVLS